MIPDIEGAIEQVIELAKKYYESSRELSLVITKLEEAELWAQKIKAKQ